MPIPPPANAKKVFQGEIYSVYQWPQKMYDGSTETFECMIRPDTVTVIPFLDEKTVIVTKQQQPHKADPFLCFPGGRVDPGETLEEAGAREFREETGYTAGRLIPWFIIPWKGIYRFEEAIYVATDVKKDPRGIHEDAGEKIEVLEVPWKNVVQNSLRRELRGPHAMLAVLGMEFDPEQRKRLNEFLLGRA